MLTLISCSSHSILFLSIEFEISARKDRRHDNNPHICTEYRIQTWRHSSSSSHLILTTRRLEIEEDRPQKQVEIGDDNNKKGSGILWLLFSLFYLETFQSGQSCGCFSCWWDDVQWWKRVRQHTSDFCVASIFDEIFPGPHRSAPIVSIVRYKLGVGDINIFSLSITPKYCEQTRIQWTLVICHKKSSNPPARP